MAKRRAAASEPLTDEAGEVRELTRADLAAFRPAADVLPTALAAQLPKRRVGERGPQKAPTKQQVNVRLDADVLEHFRAGGAGWQTRLNAALRRAVDGERQAGGRDREPTVATTERNE